MHMRNGICNACGCVSWYGSKDRVDGLSNLVGPVGCLERTRPTFMMSVN